MRGNIIIFLSLLFCCSSCGQPLFDVEEEFLGIFSLTTDEYHLEVVNVASGATSDDVMQFRKVAKNGSYYVINNLSNVDSLVSCQVISDTISVVVRGKGWLKSFGNDSFKFPVGMTWTSERFPARQKARKRKD
jgi:hypothetical protein